jgi:hypothetical protein
MTWKNECKTEKKKYMEEFTVVAACKPLKDI